MVGASRYPKCFLSVLSAGFLLVSLVNAAVPTGYIGKPYPPGSPPHEIPGRINFHDYDYVPPSLGSSNNVTFVQDDQAGDAGSTAGGRDGQITGIPKDSDNAWPAFYQTWHSDHDTFYAVGVVYPNGTRYPSLDTSISDFYIGASHANSMTKFTIHVPKAGKYWISSIWAADAYPISFHINFMNGTNTVSTATTSLDGSGSWHAWRKYNDFLSVQLDSGVQVMQFQNNNVHLNQDFLYFASDTGKMPTGVEQPMSKASGNAQSNLAFDKGLIKLTVPDAGETKISVYDCLGREIASLLDRSVSAGSHTVVLNESGLKRGVYFVRMEHGGAASVAKFQCTR